MMRNRRKNKKLFLIPFHIKETLQNTVAWDGLPCLPKQGILDKRSELDKANIRLGNSVATFKK